MKKLVDCFDYLKRYHSDILDVVSIVLELCIFKQENAPMLSTMIGKSQKRKLIKDEFHSLLENLIGSALYVPISANVNLTKILKTIEASSIALSDIEQFLHIISQKRTTNKLYYYSTPSEVNNLLAMLLDLQDNDEVYNPCYGIGSIFLSLANLNPKIHLYGEELDERLARIARLIARLTQISAHELRVNDILKQPIFKIQGELQRFHKVICNPPLHAHMGIAQLKEDERFHKIGILAKNSPELVFLTHALAHLRHRGVFIVRNQTLQKSFLEEKLREKLVQERMIEAVIELPKNIFPHQACDFSILVLSYNNTSILHINANNPHFYIKDGKYNRLRNIDEIASLFKQKRAGQYSKITHIDSVQTHDLRASYHLLQQAAPTHELRLSSLNISTFRGQRVYGGTKDEAITYYDVGIADFAHCGFSTHFTHIKTSGDREKIQKYRLEPYDILLSLRSIIPKVAILGREMQECVAVANAGILILRLPNREHAIGLYCYFFSNEGFARLREAYEKSGDGMMYVKELLNSTIPPHYIHEGAKRMEFIESLRHEFEHLERKLQQFKQT